jgi:hypothetical protein
MVRVPELPEAMVRVPGLNAAETVGVTTVSVTGGEVLPAIVVVPPYVAVRPYTPVLLKLVLRVAVPIASRAAEPRDVMPFKKFTDPVGIPPVEVTFAVSITLMPLPAVVLEDAKEMLLGMGGTVTVKVAS